MLSVMFFFSLQDKICAENIHDLPADSACNLWSIYWVITCISLNITVGLQHGTRDNVQLLVLTVPKLDSNLEEEQVR